MNIQRKRSLIYIGIAVVIATIIALMLRPKSIYVNVVSVDRGVLVNNKQTPILTHRD